MKFSIVTISFNQVEFLERTILSVLDQDYHDIQYIIVDPGSTDGSRELIEKYKSRISKIVFEPDKGPSDGLNKGFAYAEGDYYGYLNSDDILFPGALSQAASFFKKKPSVDVISGHAYVINEHDEILRKSFSQKMNLTHYAYGACVMNQPSTFFRSEIFSKAGGFNAENKSNWDGELFVDMALQGAKFELIDKFWSGYRLHDVSITASAKMDSAIRQYQEKIFQKIMGHPLRSVDRRIAFARRMANHLTHPRALVERIMKGPIYGRNASTAE